MVFVCFLQFISCLVCAVFVLVGGSLCVCFVGILYSDPVSPAPIWFLNLAPLA